MTRLAPLMMLLAACAGGGQAGDFDNCSTDCPEGTRNSNYVSTVRSGAGRVVEGACESYCEPIASCLAPQVPIISADAYECASIEGISSIPADADVDFSFTQAWEWEASR